MSNSKVAPVDDKGSDATKPKHRLPVQSLSFLAIATSAHRDFLSFLGLLGIHGRGKQENPVLQVSLPNLHQVLRSSVYRRRLQPKAVLVKQKARLNDDDSSSEMTEQGKEKALQEEIDEEVEKNTRETLMGATIDGLVNKAIISALFLTFNIPAIMEPPLEVDMGDPSYVIFYLSAGFSIASGFYVILAGTFITTHTKAAIVMQSMAEEFSAQLAAPVLMIHYMFIFQGMATSTQVAAVCVGLMGEDNWALWLVVGSCMLSFFAVAGVMTRIQVAWKRALKMEE